MKSKRDIVANLWRHQSVLRELSSPNAFPSGGPFSRVSIAQSRCTLRVKCTGRLLPRLDNARGRYPPPESRAF
jgi:hypothetical protein